jgi:ethanolamine utilization protein EutP (predicted NTPase)
VSPEQSSPNPERKKTVLDFTDEDLIKKAQEVAFNPEQPLDTRTRIVENLYHELYRRGTEISVLRHEADQIKALYERNKNKVTAEMISTLRSHLEAISTYDALYTTMAAIRSALSEEVRSNS